MRSRDTKHFTPQTIILRREDIRNPVHPYLWEEMCEQFGYDGDIEELELRVIKAEGY